MAEARVEERELVKAMTWWDGFMVALANPGFLFAALGGSVGALGTAGAAALWTIAVLLGAFQNNIYAELATMFPNKAGGIALYAHEAWRKYCAPLGAIATFGYWFAWSSVLAVSGLIVGTLLQAQFFSTADWSFQGAGFELNLPIAIAIVTILLVWFINSRGVRSVVGFSYVTGALLLIPTLALMFLPYLTGDFKSANLEWSIGENGGIALALTWMYFMVWSAYGFETVAAFAPEYHDTSRDTPRALRAAALFSVLVYALLPLGLGGTLGTEAVAADASLISFYKEAFDALGGALIGGALTLCLVGGLILTMSTATMDGSRALYGIAKDGMTVRQLAVLNNRNVPERGMALDALLNILMVTFLGSTLEILAAGNLGYLLAHVLALSGFLLLRKDRPDWPRPIRLSNVWLGIAAVLVVINTSLMVLGGFVYANEFGYGLNKTMIGAGVLLVSLLLYVYRRRVQDHLPVQMREETPLLPEDVGRPLAAPVTA